MIVPALYALAAACIAGAIRAKRAQDVATGQYRAVTTKKVAKKAKR